MLLLFSKYRDIFPEWLRLVYFPQLLSLPLQLQLPLQADKFSEAASLHSVEDSSFSWTCLTFLSLFLKPQKHIFSTLIFRIVNTQQLSNKINFLMVREVLKMITKMQIALINLCEAVLSFQKKLCFCNNTDLYIYDPGKVFTFSILINFLFLSFYSKLQFFYLPKIKGYFPVLVNRCFIRSNWYFSTNVETNDKISNLISHLKGKMEPANIKLLI